MRMSCPMVSAFLAAFLLVCLTAFPAPGHITSDQPVYRASDGKTITFRQMLEDLKGTDVVVIGESHDSPEHHQLQLAVINAYRQAETPIAVGMEMFTTDSQRQLDRWTSGTLDQSSFIRLYYRNWQMPWPLYSEILLYARKHRIPLIGLNIDPKIPKKVARRGFAALSEKELKKIPKGVTCNVDPDYMAFIRQVYSSHNKSDKSFTHFCEAQRLWNSFMASEIVDYLSKNDGKTMVVLTGAGHALKSGIPAELERVSDVSCKVILPEFPELAPEDEADGADYILLEQ
ncbi:ChaN family lipoprotein [Geotalea sp. SG265]|uniref:ChaN family lipoprotein n=1 Tax=Geotalea sp. SG265 TaxID=2922867 RepID=UPI001FAE9967|nr:ChaN family lipoprotein [Geotalea sp. SG265]